MSSMPTHADPKPRAAVRCPLSLLAALLLISAAPAADFGDLGTVAKWQKFEVALTGPDSSATADPNPFAILIDATFTAPSGATITVPGFYNGDNAGGSSGDQWVVRFGADEVGEWSFETSSAETSLDGHTGTFTVTPVPNDAAGFFKLGRLEYTGTAANQIRYFSTRDGGYWLKSGADSPETFLSFSTDNYYHSFERRRAGIDHLASKGINSLYMMVGMIGGDRPSLVWPWLGATQSEVDANAGSDDDPEDEALDDPSVRFAIDRLADWDRIFVYMQHQGVACYLIGQDDDSSHDYNHARYYRELIARFGWMPGVMFNDKEETGIIGRAVQFSQLDPYGIPVASHNHNHGDKMPRYLAEPDLDMTSIQSSSGINPFLGESCETDAKKAVGGLGHNCVTIGWIEAAIAAGVRVPVVCFDEPRGGSPDREEWLAAYLGGAGGYEYIETSIGGVEGPGNRFEDYDHVWGPLGGARTFMETVPYWRMQPRNDLVSDGHAFCLAELGEVYICYLADSNPGSGFTIDLSGGRYGVVWWDPTNGQDGSFLDGGEVDGGSVTLTPPQMGNGAGDWLVRLRRIVDDGTPPSQVTGLAAEAIHATRVAVSWSAASDPESGITAYRVLRDGSLVGTVSELTFLDETVSPDTSYGYTVRAVNGGGTVGPASEVAQVTTPDSAGSPSVTITAPAGGAELATGVAVAITADASDDDAVLSVEFVVLDDESGAEVLRVSDTDGSNGWSVSWSNPQDGAYLISASASDSIGQSVGATPVAVMVINNSGDVLDYLFRWTFDDSILEFNGSPHDANTLGDADFVTNPSRVGTHAIALDGAGDRIVIEQTDGSALETAFTARSVSLWFRAESTDGLQLLYEEGGSFNGLALRLNGSTLEAAVQDDDGGPVIASVDGVRVRSWHHAVVVFSGSGSSGELSVYLDAGSPGSIGTGFGSVGDHSSGTAIGGNNGDDPADPTVGDTAFDSIDPAWTGHIDDVRIWGRALDADDVQTLYEAQASIERSISVGIIDGHEWTIAPAAARTEATTVLQIFAGLDAASTHRLEPSPDGDG